MKCAQCGKDLQEGQLDCPACLAPVVRPGFWKRLWALLATPAPQTRVLGEKITERIEFVDRKTGQRQFFSSLADVPPELRAQIDEARAQGHVTVNQMKFSIQGLDGQTRTFHSLEELPAEYREIAERALAPDIRALMKGARSSGPQ